MLFSLPRKSLLGYMNAYQKAYVTETITTSPHLLWSMMCLIHYQNTGIVVFHASKGLAHEPTGWEKYSCECLLYLDVFNFDQLPRVPTSATLGMCSFLLHCYIPDLFHIKVSITIYHTSFFYIKKIHCYFLSLLKILRYFPFLDKSLHTKAYDKKKISQLWKKNLDIAVTFSIFFFPNV